MAPDLSPPIRIVYELQGPDNPAIETQKNSTTFEEIKEAATRDSIVYIRSNDSGYFVVDNPDTLQFALSRAFSGNNPKIVVRPSSARSPNSSPLPGSPTRFEPSHISHRNNIDPFTLDAIVDLDPGSVAKINDQQYHTEIQVER
jgi:hypothetical protein